MEWGECLGTGGGGGDTKVMRVRAAEGEERENGKSEIRVCFTPVMISTTNRPLVLQDLACSGSVRPKARGWMMD